MRKLHMNVYTEIYFWGCNPSFVTTSEGVVMIDAPQQPIDAVRWRERMLEHGPIRYLINTEPHPDHVLGNAYYPGVEVVGQAELRSRYLDLIPMMTSAQRIETMKQTDPDSVWLLGHPSYPPNPPALTFEDELTLRVGNHSFHCIHLPGHTRPQTAVHVPEEGVLFVGDNIFHETKTFIQEADPWEWLAALKRIEQFDVEVIVPGHGEPCDRSYARRQAEIIESWLGVVGRFVERGLTLDEALGEPLDVPRIDPYPIGQRLFNFGDVDAMNVRNLYQRIRARR
ncbi:MAG TPA: MBL fold metallo-hydrolase [Candidatus Dormibacteraeota bacterium]|nr:MBL fold metallo-hydrolase [Candidatus Dormibacteraeota bacterium]